MTHYRLPHTLETTDGAKRQVGIEIEFAGLDGPSVAKTVAAALGGDVKENSAHKYVVADTRLGDKTVELDTRFVHAADPEEETAIGQTGRKLLGDLAQAVVPYELVTNPMDIDHLAQIDVVIDALRKAGARGTTDNPIYAFGVHLNPQAVSLYPHYLLRVMQSFVLLNDWVRSVARTDPTRRLMAWAQPYEDDYVKLILNPDYRPDLKTLISDYLTLQSGRNYDLDMLPLFSEADEELMKRLAGDMMSSARPAFHYRLPDCRISEPGWTTANDWNLWVAVEDLAEDEDRILTAIETYLRTGVLNPTGDPASTTRHAEDRSG
jgi:hypothetical protein